MEKIIERMLNNVGFTVNHNAKCITIDVYGIEAYVTYELNYNTYDNMSVPQALNLGNIITNIDPLIQEQEMFYVAIKMKPWVEKVQETHDYTELANGGFSTIVNTWKIEETIIRNGFSTLEGDIQAAILDLNERTFSSRNFEEFLDEILVNVGSNQIEVSSKYSSIKTYAQTKDEIVGAVLSYKDKLIASGELEFLNFSSWDAVFALTVSEKYGISWDDNDDVA